MWGHGKAQRVYMRELPGGGFVAIDVTPMRSMIHGKCFSGTLIVERRANWRRQGHTPPSIAYVTGTTSEEVLRQLLPTAQSNAAIAAALLHRAPITA